MIFVIYVHVCTGRVRVHIMRKHKKWKPTSIYSKKHDILVVPSRYTRARTQKKMHTQTQTRFPTQILTHIAHTQASRDSHTRAHTQICTLTFRHKHTSTHEHTHSCMERRGWHIHLTHDQPARTLMIRVRSTWHTNRERERECVSTNDQAGTSACKKEYCR